MELKEIAVIHTDFPGKVWDSKTERTCRGIAGNDCFFPGIQKCRCHPGACWTSPAFGFVWGFSKAKKDHWSATVRPPRLGGQVRMGIFATRSPFRPNPIGLSSVKLGILSRMDDEARVPLSQNIRY